MASWSTPHSIGPNTFVVSLGIFLLMSKMISWGSCVLPKSLAWIESLVILRPDDFKNIISRILASVNQFCSKYSIPLQSGTVHILRAWVPSIRQLLGDWQTVLRCYPGEVVVGPSCFAIILDMSRNRLFVANRTHYHDIGTSKILSWEIKCTDIKTGLVLARLKSRSEFESLGHIWGQKSASVEFQLKMSNDYLYEERLYLP
ncbi:uncharacterized protein K441DRAFT_315632 [Cenococcum geophilum 1.58]|uniref:Uncharacterized protein n=1 Tax=Cenococcum geophilum 1.58 TaxID=794803 RepID=A0ACC8EPT7_9PEZI|nr:hypothetical protein K441DRAFT_315632 [Cenococcum geophilum 1.58]